MKKKRIVAVVLISLATSTFGENYWIELLEKYNESRMNGITGKAELERLHASLATNTNITEWFRQNCILGGIDSVSVSSTSLTVKIASSIAHYEPRLAVRMLDTDASSTQGGMEIGGVARGVQANEELVLPLDKKTNFNRELNRTLFTPVMFKGGQKGFKISAEANFDFIRCGTLTNVLYVALGDTPVQVGEEDIDKFIMITTENSDGISALKRFGFDPVSVTPKSLSLWLKPQSQDFVVELEGVKRLSAEYKENNEPLVLFAGQSARIVNEQKDFITTLVFTPVLFKNHRKVFGGIIPSRPLDGFRLMLKAHRRDDGSEWMADTRYIALSDTPILMGEAELDDSKKPQVSQPSRKKPVNVTKAKIPDKITEDEPNEEKNKANIFWLYAIIPLCLLAILYLMRRKPAS